MKLNLATVLANLLFLFVLFPYVSIVNTPFDTQPYAVVISACIFLLMALRGKDRMPKPLAALFFFSLLSVVVMLFSPQTFMSGLRSVVGYMTLFFVAFAAYKTIHLINPKILIYSTWVWFFVAIIQTVVSKRFGEFLLPSLRTSTARGVTSLAVEPSYYAIVMVFILLLNEIFYGKGVFTKKQYKHLLAIASIQILLSFSGMGMMFFGVFAIFKTISVVATKGIGQKLKSLVGFSAIAAVTLFAFTSIPKLVQSRAGVLLSQLFRDPMNLIMSDMSIAQRLSHILISTFSVLQNYGIGHGVGQFEIKAQAVMSELPEPIWRMLVTQGVTPGGRIMSGWGSSIFELGIIGFLPLILFIYVMRKAMKRSNKSVYIVCFGVAFTLMWMSVPYSFPLFAYLMGFALYDVYRVPAMELTQKFSERERNTSQTAR